MSAVRRWGAAILAAAWVAACGEPDELVDLCGDARVDPGEACDDGVNDGAYSGCAPGCLSRAPYCGDAELDEAEACDDGVNDGAWGSCAPGCAEAGPRCGDGEVNGPEACDDGVNNGGYGGCRAGCLKSAPFCGDGAVNGPESCDDGVNDGRCGSCLEDCSDFGRGRFLVEVSVRSIGGDYGGILDTPDLFVEILDESGSVLFVTATFDDRQPTVTFTIDDVRVDSGQPLIARVWDEDGGAFGDDDYMGDVVIDTTLDDGNAANAGTRVAWMVRLLPCDG